MRRQLIIALAGLLLPLAGAGISHAQYLPSYGGGHSRPGFSGTTRGFNQAFGRPFLFSRPTVSPYLTLGTGSPAANYYGLIRPEQQMRTTLEQQRSYLQQLQSGVLEGEGPALRPKRLSTLGATGHAVYFQTYSHYYPQPGR